jgi:hypothetical protein
MLITISPIQKKLVKLPLNTITRRVHFGPEYFHILNTICEFYVQHVVILW